MVIDTKILFLQSKNDYYTEYEGILLEFIKRRYPGCEVISVSDINKKIDDADRNKELKYIEEKYFFPVIDCCDIIIAAPYSRNGRFTIGVVVEMRYAASKGKKIRVIGYGGDLQIVDIEGTKDIEEYENDIEYCIPGEEPVRMKDVIKSKGF